MLLKNDKTVLPLSTSTIKTVAVIGPNGNATTTMQGMHVVCCSEHLTLTPPNVGNYYGTACQLISPVQGISAYVDVISAPGCGISDPSVSGFGEACTVRRTVGLSLSVQGY